MSINFTLRKEGITDNVHISMWQISCQDLKKEIGKKLRISNQLLTISNINSGIPYTSFETIRSGSTVAVQRISKSKQLVINEIINEEELDQMALKARFFMIKSSNQENVQKARQHSVWATTFSNQDKLKVAFNYSEHVFLIFATNRSYELKGLARMESEPSKTPDKAIWSGVSNIRLGGNFRIRWIRKKPLNCSQIQKVYGIGAKDEIMRLCDGQQADADTCRKVIKLFQIPKQADVIIRKEQPHQVETKVATVGDILGSQPSLTTPFSGFISNSMIPMPMMPHFMNSFHHMNTIMMEQMKAKMEQEKKSKKKKKDKKKKKSDSSSSESSQSSSEKSHKNKKIKKDKHKKHKHKKHRHEKKDI